MTLLANKISSKMFYFMSFVFISIFLQRMHRKTSSQCLRSYIAGRHSSQQTNKPKKVDEKSQKVSNLKKPSLGNKMIHQSRCPRRVIFSFSFVIVSEWV